MTVPNYTRHFRLAYNEAAQAWGSGWTFLSPAMRRAAVAERILNIVTTQDESVSDGAVRDLAETMWADLLEALPDD